MKPEPTLNEALSLLLGMLWGDGWIVNHNLAKLKGHRVGLVQDDKLFLGVAIDLIKDVFNITPKIYDRKTKVEVYFSNKNIYGILNKTYGFPDGEKRNRLRIPLQILEHKNLAFSFLKGLFSADGDFTVYKGYPRIRLSSASLSFAKDVESILLKYGFNPRLAVCHRKRGNDIYRLSLNGFNQTKCFSKDIGFVGEKANKLVNFLTNHSPVV